MSSNSGARLSEESIQKLRSFIKIVHGNERTLDYFHGFTTAFILSPVMLPMDLLSREFLLTEEEGEYSFKTNEQFIEFKRLFTSLNNSIMADVDSEAFSPYMNGYDPCDPEKNNPEEWCMGFLCGMELWIGELEKDIVEKIKVSLLPIYMSAEHERAKAFFKSEDYAAKSATLVFNTVPKIVPELEKIFHNVRMESLGLSNTPETSDRVGRNDPCPCGSGKKFKKCCGK